MGGTEVVRLADTDREMTVCVAPPAGNLAFEFNVRGKNILWFPFRGPDEFKAAPVLCGIPFLAPWANRIDGDAYWVNDRKYTLNPLLGNLRRDANQRPIHGLLLFSGAWELMSAEAGMESASVTSRLPFWRHPELMAQFPFAHTISMTHRLCGGSLEVETRIENHATEPLPVAIGYHPYFQLHDAPREEWKVHIAARAHLLLDEFLIPTGERRPVAFADPYSLQEGKIDDVFTDLIRDGDAAARFSVTGKNEKITVAYGPKFPVAVIYAPVGRPFICFEPMAALTNPFNLARRGVYGELQSIAPGGEWRESFRITPEGF
ncbi:MAG: hypothetical protein C5B51_16250 [Terriglobia bacterium]|nr:MAG: hypothetical protein C5B51_16250 [Terriglobia bacterium]